MEDRGMIPILRPDAVEVYYSVAKREIHFEVIVRPGDWISIRNAMEFLEKTIGRPKIEIAPYEILVRNIDEVSISARR